MVAPATLIGRVLGHFRVLEQIGAGGMGVVFRARDEHLDRDVAIKVLPQGALGDSDARRRFRNEALALSRINHPHIATIFDFSTEKDLDFLVMELVSGVALDRKLARGPLSEQEVGSLGGQIALALEEAHEHGIVHRDLKPANIMLTPRGHVKVLDFGVARLLRPEGPAEPTASVTEAVGVSGTLPYMSPEQLQGRPADTRCDLWALGVVLFEMATGGHPFREKLSTALVNEIINAAAPVPSLLRPALSPQLDFIILKCLEKDPEDRYQTARELAIDLRRIATGSGRATQAPPARAAASRRPVLIAGGLFVVVGLVAAAVVALRPPAPGPAATAYEQLTHFADPVSWPAVSPDGRMLAFVRDRQIYVKLVPQSEAVRITDTPDRKRDLEFTRDGTRISYTSGNDVWIVPALGGQPRLMLRNAETLRWIDDQRVLFSRYKKGIHLALVTGHVNGSDFRDVYVPPTELGMVHDSQLSPDGMWVLLQEMDATGDLPCRLVPFDGSSSGRLVGPLSGPCYTTRWSPDGKWMYFSATIESGTHVWRQRFPDGAAEQLTFGAGIEKDFTVNPDGASLIVAVGAEQRSVWLHEPTGDRPISVESYATFPAFAPDGNTLYYLVRGGPARSFISGELWSADLVSGRREQVFPGLFVTHYSLSRDGKEIVFSVIDEHDESSVWTGPTDRSAPPRQLIAAGAHWPYFGRPGEILFLADDGPSKFLHRVNVDGSDRRKLVSDPASYFVNAGPEGDWAILWATRAGPAPADRSQRTAPPGTGPARQSPQVWAYSLAGGDPVLICSCEPWWGTMGAPLVHWDSRQRFAAFALKYLPGMDNNKTYVVPLRPGEALPVLPRSGLSSEADLAALPGADVIPHADVFLSPNPNSYAYFRAVLQQNLYRVALR